MGGKAKKRRTASLRVRADQPPRGNSVTPAPVPTVSPCPLPLALPLPVGKIRFAVKPLGEGDITTAAAVVVPCLRQSLCLLQSPTKPLLLFFSALTLARVAIILVGAWGARFNPSQDFCGVRSLHPDSARIELIASHPLIFSSQFHLGRVASFFLPDLPPPPSTSSRTRPCPSARPIHLSSSLASTPLPRCLLKPAAFLGRSGPPEASSLPGVNACPCRGSQPPPLQIPSLFAPN